MTSTHVLIFSFSIGVLGGLRCLTPPASTAWATHLGWLKLASPLGWLGSWPTVILLTLAAVGELIGDKLPSSPNRTAPPGLAARILLGGLCGAAISRAGTHDGWLIGALAGAIGAIVGSFGGLQARTRLVKALRTPDFVVAAAEDLVAIGGSLWIVSRF